MPTIRDNDFILYMMEGVTNLQISITGHSITSGQPWENTPSVAGTGNNTWKITVRAGRKGSSGVADWFRNQITGGSAIGCSTSESMPGELNFAFTCTISFDYRNKRCQLPNIVIGQGHNWKSENNWWIGSKQLKEIGTVNRLSTSSGTDFNCNIAVSGVNEFFFSLNMMQWMGKIDPDTSLLSLSIPGTHDSGTYKIPSVVVGARCQNYNIRTQLEDGIRFYDIRLVNGSNSSDPLVLYHGFVPCDVSFGEVLNACDAFLKENPSEVILMSVKNEDGSDISANFITYLNKYNSLYYRGNTVPDLQHAKGKIIFFYRFDLNVGNSGIDKNAVGVSFGAWQDNATFESANVQGQKFYIEDNYKSNDTHKKADEVKANLEKAVKTDAANQQILYVTFNSIAVGAHTPYQYAWGGLGVDPAMNPWLRNYTPYSGKKRFGIIPLDFYNNGGDNPNENGLINNIIQSNY
ncbi:phosphatidylinositol-specific phospholipase C [uncultured Chryseobacterium sp.]|uniref:phosphatidylinositol-specific phospholipase C n=1 Tax=uncultured Chryseobacterium sp. TaxID=259322 RepID=UPI0025E37DCD|nr:phosphatidylinositol-specific phospholipase C [uncultured Chryseobacterium sp.]